MKAEKDVFPFLRDLRYGLTREQRPRFNEANYLKRGQHYGKEKNDRSGLQEV